MEPLDYQVLIWEQPDAAVVAYLESGIDVNAPDRSGDYLLTVACERLRVDLVKTLLTANADPNVRNAEGNTPTLCAVDCVAHGPEKAYAIVKALVSAGASLEIRGYMDKTPFLKACCRNALGMIELLVRLGADSRATVDDGGIVSGSDFADIFHAPVEVKEFLARLQ